MKLKTAPAPQENSQLEGGSGLAHADREHEHDHGIEKAELVRIGLVGLAILAVWFRVFEPFQKFSFIGIVATLFGGYPIFQEAFEALRERKMTMELSMTIALFSALAIGEFVTTLVIVFFVLIAEVLEHLTVGRGREAIKELLEYLPDRAFVSEQGGTREIQASDIRLGDVLVVKPGARIPADGIVVSGNSFVDQATITGESIPVEKLPSASVFAGTLNQSGALEIRTTGIGENTAFGRIIQAVERAETLKAPVERTADRLAGYLVYFGLGSAGLTYCLTRDIRSTISVIIVMGACGVAAGTPLAILGAIGLAARKGAIIKGGLFLEALGYIDTVVLDKTGTLTHGNPEVSGLLPAPGVSTALLVESAAAAECLSEHPLGKAIIKKAIQMGIAVRKPERFEYIPGKGIRCFLSQEEILAGNKLLFTANSTKLNGYTSGTENSSEVLVARNGHFLGTIEIEDILRPEATEAVKSLRDMGLKVALLTGDRSSIAMAVGNKLGVDETGAELLPEQKLEWIRSRISSGKKVAMIGDGVNDAPALTEATVGIAMGSGTDVARECADVLLLGNDLLKFVETLHIARRCRRIIWFNFLGTVAVDGSGVLLAAFGLLNPIVAALIHVSSELFFILNSARLLPAMTKRK